jgi:hypothetical protein
MALCNICFNINSNAFPPKISLDDVKGALISPMSAPWAVMTGKHNILLEGCTIGDHDDGLVTHLSTLTGEQLVLNGNRPEIKASRRAKKVLGKQPTPKLGICAVCK